MEHALAQPMKVRNHGHMPLYRATIVFKAETMQHIREQIGPRGNVSAFVEDAVRKQLQA